MSGARLLVTNDDGIWAPGIQALARAAVAAGHDVLVVAPLEDCSGSGAAVGPLHVDSTIDAQSVDLPGLGGVPCFGVQGPPALAVMAARLGAFGDPPDLVLSGVNPGTNTGRVTLHSGTVGATLTGANLGASGVAVSQVAADDQRWATAAAVGLAAVDWVLGEPAGTVVNVNVPNVALDALRGARWAELAPLGTVRAAAVESDGGRLQVELRGEDDELPADCDSALVRAGYAALTSIVGIRAAERREVAPFVEDRLLRRTA